MGANGAAHCSNRQLISIAFPKLLTVVNILAQQGVGKSAVGKTAGSLEVDAATLLHKLPQQVIALT